MGDKNKVGAMRRASETVCNAAAIFVSVYGFERLWAAATAAGLPLWGVRAVVLAFVTAVILFASFVLAPAVHVLLERLVAFVNARADQGRMGS